jgi:hypothetical protein
MQTKQLMFKKIVKNSAFIVVLALVFSSVGIVEAEAKTESTYIVDLTGNGCGADCAEFYQYLISNGISLTTTNNQNTNVSVPINTNTASSTNTSNSIATTTVQSNTASSTYVPYQYYQYVTPPSTSTGSSSYVPYQYYQYATPQSTNIAPSTYVPYQEYVYFQKPTSKSALNTSSNSVSNSPIQNNTTIQKTINPDSGFTITAILN